ncbi:hypothetical protein [Sorangium sp. So ce1389]|uniref:hypothetical protein n=1 Tax=Sorangium sp. So ce1389 TaxID=3133336 RepID=UPI003F6227C3
MRAHDGGQNIEIDARAGHERTAYSFKKSDQLSVYQSWVDTVHEEASCSGWIHWRLTSKMDGGQYPKDNGEGFDAHNDGSPLAELLRRAALRQRNKGDGSRAR